MLLMVIVAAPSGCGKTEVRNCSDDLGGVWRDRGGRQYHVVDGQLIRVFPLFDSTHTKNPGIAKAPFYFELHRRPTAISGSRMQRLTKGAASCRPKTPAELVSCKSNTLTITFRHAAVEGWQEDACTWSRGPTTSLQLKR